MMVLNVYMQFLKQEKVHSKLAMITSGKWDFKNWRKKQNTFVLRDYCTNHLLALRNNKISPIWLICNKPTIILWTYVKLLKQAAL